VAAKTGTTNDYSNAWFVGYTPRLVTGVWVGYDRPRSLGRDETGGRLAAPIWTSYMTRILGDTPKEDFPVPDRVVIVSVDLDPSNECIRPVPMAFVKGTEPATSCGARRQMTPLVPSPAPPSTLVPPPSAAAPREVAATSPAAGSSADRRSEGPSPQGP
jgi:penicillin-binding protein 2D